jgi:hypothetical protein
MRRAVLLMKDDAVVLDHLAEVLVKLGKTDEAIKVCAKPTNSSRTTRTFPPDSGN